MAGLEALAFFVLVPAAAWGMELLVLRSAYAATQRDMVVRGLTPPPSRVYVLVGYGATPLVLGMALWALSMPLTAELGAAGVPGSSGLEAMSVWAAAMYGAAATCTSLARAVVLRSRLAGALGSDFGRVLPLLTVPFTCSMFAMVLVFLLFGYVDFAVGSGQVASVSAVDGVTAAFQAYAVATLGFPAAALASNRVRDISLGGFQRALLLAVAGEIPAVVGLSWAFLAIGKLYPT